MSAERRGALVASVALIAAVIAVLVLAAAVGRVAGLRPWLVAALVAVLVGALWLRHRALGGGALDHWREQDEARDWQRLVERGRDGRDEGRRD